MHQTRSSNEADCLAYSCPERKKLNHLYVFNRMVAEVYETLPAHLRLFARDQTLCEQWFQGSKYCFPARSLSPVLGEKQEEEGHLPSSTTPKISSRRKTSLHSAELFIWDCKGRYVANT